MKTMILAAGRGVRMRPLTDTVPKPLLQIGEKSLIEYLIGSLVAAGLREIVINCAYRAESFVAKLGNGANYGAKITYSNEGAQGLETGGGIYRALPLLDSDPFVVVNGDIWTDYPFSHLPRRLDALAHLVLVDNPPHHAHGDFYLDAGRMLPHGKNRVTFSGIGVYTHALFKDCRAGKFPLAPLLRTAIAQGMVTGEHYRGLWDDVGTPERLAMLHQRLTGNTGL